MIQTILISIGLVFVVPIVLEILVVAAGGILMLLDPPAPPTVTASVRDAEIEPPHRGDVFNSEMAGRE